MGATDLPDWKKTDSLELKKQFVERKKKKRERKKLHPEGTHY